MFSKKNILLFIVFTIIVFALQFIIARKHIYYGFTSDDWYLLAWYKQVVKDPLLDIAKAWKEIGSHNFARVYYVGTLFSIFQYNFPLYHIFHTLLKALASLSLFPIVYLLFKKRSLAFLATFLFSVHLSTFATLDGVYSGSPMLVIISMNIFLAFYIWLIRKHNFSIKNMFILLILLLSASFFDIPRFYPVLFLLPALELINYLLNRSSTTLKGSILRLIFLYSPFIALALYFPPAVSDFGAFGINKPIHVFRTGNFQLFIAVFASFGSTFIPEGLLEQVSNFARVGNNALYQDFGTFLNFLLFRFLLLAYPALLIICLLLPYKSKWFILRSLFLSIFFSFLAFFAANHWIYLDPKIKAGVDPGVYFIYGLVGLFVFSTSIAFFIEWLKKRDDYFLLALSLASLSSLLYTFSTWVLAGDNVIFTGIHSYLSIAAIGSTLYLAIIFYLAFQKIRFGPGIIRRIAGSFIIFYLLFFMILNAQQIDEYYAFGLKYKYAASDQKRIQTSFWKEVGKGESIDKSPILVYLDTSADDGYFYGAAFTWDIPSLLTVEKGLPFDPGGHCKYVISANDFDKLRIEEVNGKKMVVRGACGPDRYYKLENFYAFKIINRELVPIKSEIVNKLGDK